ncbi:MAG: hypothetical protein ACFFBP_13925 [Promethearchaeota archaeon]
MNVDISCPACKRTGQIQIKDNMVESSHRNVTVVDIAQDTICEHSFIVFIDKDLKIKDCYVCDFKIELPKGKIKTEEPFSLSANYDIDIIRLSVLPSLMVHVLKGIFIGKKIAIISNNELLSRNILEFFINITSDSFNLELFCIDESEYIKEKNKYGDFLVLEGVNVVNDNDKLINEKDLKIERAIVQKFFSENDPEISIIIIKDEIYKIFKLVEALIGFNKNYNKKNPFTMKKALEFFENEFKIQIPVPYLSYLADIVEKRFNIELYKTDKFTDFLGLF